MWKIIWTPAFNFSGARCGGIFFDRRTLSRPAQLDGCPPHSQTLCGGTGPLAAAHPFVCYPVLLCLLNVRLFRLLGSQRQAALDLTAVIARTVFVPGLTFWGGTILRDRLNLPRPYEQPGFEPLRHKETRGHSFPSRHALSASVLAMVWMYFYPKAGWAMVGITVLICVGRVLTGVHHIRDVVGGAALGFALGFAGMWLL